VFRRVAAATGIPVDSATTVKSWAINAEPEYGEDVENHRTFAINVMNNAYNIERDHALPRRVLEIPVIERSFSILDAIISISEIDLISSIDLLYIAAYRYWEKRFSESVVLSWSVSEKLINIAWERYLRQKGRVSSRRRQQLISSRDFTASVVSEILELSDILPSSLYDRLGQSRRARNSWAHELRHLAAQDAQFSIAACQDLLNHLFGVRIFLSFGYRGGYGSMPAAIYDQMHR
jgi:hypothetical protein